MRIDIDQYFKYVLDNNLARKWGWVTSLIGIHSEGIQNEYIKIEKGVGYVYIAGSYVEFDNYKKGTGFVTISDNVKVSKETLKSLDADISTSVGILLVNYILIEIPFNGGIKYVNNKLSLTGIIKTVKEALSSETITVDEYKKFVISCTYLEMFNKLVTPVSTEKSMLPPPGLKEFKTKLKLEFEHKYGLDWGKVPTVVVEYDTKLKDFYNEYIKNDPSNDIIVNKKNKGNALAKKYLTFSSTNAFGEQVHIENSLDDGYPTDPKKLAAMFNTVRAASYSRGAETQKGGAVAKSVLRATSSITIIPGDCGVTYGKETFVSQDNIDGLLGRYIIVNKKLVNLTVDNLSKYLNKTVELRSPLYCITPKPQFCSICMGDKAAGHDHGVALIVTNISSVLTLAALKAMHNSQLSTVTVNFDEMIT